MHIFEIALHFAHSEKWNGNPGAAARFNVEDDEKFYFQDFNPV